MSMTHEWYEATTTSVFAVDRATEVNDQLIQDECAVIFEGDSAMVLTGSFYEVERLLIISLMHLNKLRAETG